MTSARPHRSLVTFLRVALGTFGFSPLWVIPARTLHSLQWIADLFDFWFTVQCHQAPGRILHIGGAPAPVCARCLGIYLGLGLGGLIARPYLSARAVRFWMVAAMVLMMLDVGTEHLDLRPPLAMLRGLTGALLSYPAAIAALQAARHRPRA